MGIFRVDQPRPQPRPLPRELEVLLPVDFVERETDARLLLRDESGMTIRNQFRR